MLGFGAVYHETCDILVLSSTQNISIYTVLPVYFVLLFSCRNPCTFYFGHVINQLELSDSELCKLPPSVMPNILDLVCI